MGSTLARAGLLTMAAALLAPAQQNTIFLRWEELSKHTGPRHPARIRILPGVTVEGYIAGVQPGRLLFLTGLSTNPSLRPVGSATVERNEIVQLEIAKARRSYRRTGARAGLLLGGSLGLAFLPIPGLARLALASTAVGYSAGAQRDYQETIRYRRVVFK
jgi:hypothetical protein